MKNIPDKWFEQRSEANFCVVAILAHSGIVGDEDDLLVFDPKLSQEFSDFGENIHLLYEFAKMRGKRFVSWQEALVDLNFNQTGEVMVLQKWCNPIPWDREIVYCSPNKRIEM